MFGIFCLKNVYVHRFQILCFLSFVADVTGMSQIIFNASFVSKAIETGLNESIGFCMMGRGLFAWREEGVQTHQKWCQHYPFPPAKHDKTPQVPFYQTKTLWSTLLQFFCNIPGPLLLQNEGGWGVCACRCLTVLTII